MPANIELKDCFKTYTLDQDKAVSPEETVIRVKERRARAGLQVLDKTGRIDNGRLEIPVYISICGADALKTMPTGKQMGKGATPAQAEASAVMELVERFSFFHFKDHTSFIHGAYDEVADKALPFEHLAASVHHDPNDLGRAREAMAGLRLFWVPALNLTDRQEYLVPFNWFYEINEFNGPAAGNTFEEAIIQGLAEVVERHVSALICRGRLSLPSIDTASFSSPAALELVEKYKRCGIRLFIKDFSLDMGIPTVGALAYDPSTFPQLSEIVYTAGTATDQEKAVIRALTEVAQLAGDFNSRANFVASGLPKYTELSQAEYVTRPDGLVSISDLPDISDDNMKIEVERLVAALNQRGFNVYVINTTQPALDIPAVYTIVPGARFRERALGSSVPFFAAKILTYLENPGLVFEGLERLHRLYPESYFLDFFRGQVYLNQGRYHSAVKCFERALELGPHDQDRPGILTYLGMGYKELEDYERAIEHLERSAELDDERQDTFNQLGFCYYKTQQHEKAIRCFERVLKIDPTSAIDYANIGSNYRQLGKYEEAVQYYKTALELDPGLDWVRENLARLL